MSVFDAVADAVEANRRVWLAVGGVGLAVYGLSRGSWAGWTLAAAGGFLIYYGLRRPVRRASPLPPAAVPPADSPIADRFLRDSFDWRARAAAVGR